MSWKLQAGLAIICFGLGIAGLLQHADIIPLDTPLFWVLMLPALVELLPAMLFRCNGNCVDGFFVDSAHGPPFLTVAGFSSYISCLPSSWHGKQGASCLCESRFCRKGVEVRNNKRTVDQPWNPSRQLLGNRVNWRKNAIALISAAGAR
jgi:hypothetical protein